MRALILIVALTGCASDASKHEEPLPMREKVPGQDRGIVQVNVIDSSTGLPLVGARVVVTGLHLGYERQGESDAQGHFLATSLPFGELTVRVSHPSFAPFTTDGVHVENDKTTAVDARLTRTGM